ncbi:Divergent AAA domain protein [Symmachiella dynata]|uniref:Divergent AAA domain protein n=1 Tax=Symmachiella dynata TaxID=2527995 RepID=A0A517ZVY5_9PLAN|nr:ATP-binding protein [Symmachiella dynata]QDU46596.1 Divergent AAA domain protein [Symmachiella dynata]
MSSVNLSDFDLSMLPTAEDDEYEFKSSKSPEKSLKEEISRAVSAFGNSGGGYFIAGVNGTGNADGGFPKTKGRQDFRDWADQIIHLVEPTPPYSIKLIDEPNGRGTIDNDNVVLVIAVGESQTGPHMAKDNKYYIRSGAHTDPARHFIVDAIWAKRFFGKPRLSHVFRQNPDNSGVIQLGVVAVTQSPAINVEISLSPLQGLLEGHEKYFPLQIAVIDSNNPFYMDVTFFFEAEKHFGASVDLAVSYKDLAGNPYVYKTCLEVSRSIPSLSLGKMSLDKVVGELKSISKALNKKRG